MAREHDRGQVVHRSRSKSLGEERQVLVSLPRSSWDDRMRHPLLIVLDGSPFVIFHARASLIDRDIRDFVVAAVPNADRLRDMSHENIGEIWPTSGGADRFLAFLTDELVPWLDAEFQDERHRVIKGGSAAGRSRHTLCSRRRRFSTPRSRGARHSEPSSRCFGADTIPPAPRGAR